LLYLGILQIYLLFTS